jgi:hypothetical protein
MKSTQRSPHICPDGVLGVAPTASPISIGPEKDFIGHWVTEITKPMNSETLILKYSKIKTRP